MLSFVLEQLKVEGIIDLFFTIHSLRQQQPGLVQTFVSPRSQLQNVYKKMYVHTISQEQYQFCYKAVFEVLESFDHYTTQE